MTVLFIYTYRMLIRAKEERGRERDAIFYVIVVDGDGEGREWKQC